MVQGERNSLLMAGGATNNAGYQVRSRRRRASRRRYNVFERPKLNTTTGGTRWARPREHSPDLHPDPLPRAFASSAQEILDGREKKKSSVLSVGAYVATVVRPLPAPAPRSPGIPLSPDRSPSQVPLPPRSIPRTTFRAF